MASATRSFTEQYLDSCGMFRDAVISILAVVAKQARSSFRIVHGLKDESEADRALTVTVMKFGG
jgi:hypothetical protein